MSIPFNIRHLEEVGSTMDAACEMIDEAKDAPFGVLADSQCKGRGTGGRVWTSPKGNMYFTYGVPERMIRAELLPILPLVTGLAARAAIFKLLQGANVQLKWPNDIIFDAKKLGGSVVENEKGFLLFGVGINVNLAPPVTDSGRPSTCINDIAEKIGKPKITPKDVAEGLWTCFFELICNEQLTRAEVVRRFDDAMDKTLKLHRRTEGGRNPEELTAVKLNEWGHLVVRRPTGEEETLSAEYLF